MMTETDPDDRPEDIAAAASRKLAHTAAQIIEQTRAELRQAKQQLAQLPPLQIPPASFPPIQVPLGFLQPIQPSQHYMFSPDALERTAAQMRAGQGQLTHAIAAAAAITQDSLERVRAARSDADQRSQSQYIDQLGRMQYDIVRALADAIKSAYAERYDDGDPHARLSSAGIAELYRQVAENELRGRAAAPFAITLEDNEGMLIIRWAGADKPAGEALSIEMRDAASTD